MATLVKNMLIKRGQQSRLPAKPAMTVFTEAMLAVNDDIRCHSDPVNLDRLSTGVSTMCNIDFGAVTQREFLRRILNFQL